MKSKFYLSILLISVFAFLTGTAIFAQSSDSKSGKKTKEEKEAEKIVLFNKVDSLVKYQQFVFQAEFNPGSDEVFVVIDSSYAMIQNGNRNNLEGRVTKYDVTKNEKNKTLSITIMMRGSMSNGDIFLFIDSSGVGRAKINSSFPGDFSFNGSLIDFESSNIYEGGAHSIH